MEYEIIRSRRRTIALEVTREGALLVRAPLRMSARQIAAFAEEHRQWAENAMERQQARKAAHPERSEQEIAQLRKRAKSELPTKVRFFAEKMQLYPTGLAITAARTRFGSCSAKNRICFSLYLMEYPEQAIDYVVVHELAHIRYKNHGAEFYRLIESVLPDYRARKAMLRE